jgi:glycosyltransferase involved in cell wall biosynthesis
MSQNDSKHGPLISVITPTFNSIHTLRETIESVRAQDYNNWEHIVVDGGSTDGTVELLKEYPHLKWVSEKDEGHYDAMNKGVQRATGSVVNILNSDDCYRPEALRKVAEEFQQHPEWDGLFGDIVYVDGASQEIYRREEALYDYDVLRYSRLGYVMHQALFIKKTVHDRLGWYRHKEFLTCCDYDFILRLGQAKLPIGHVRALLVNYRYHQHGQSADVRIARNMVRESMKIQRAHGVPGGMRGAALRFYYRGKRQFQKLIHRGKVDLIPGSWLLKKHMKTQTTFTSNTNFEKI